MSVLAATHAYWYASRAAGTAAMVLASTSVAYGLLTAGKLLPRRFPTSRVMHEALSIATLVAIAVHGLVLLGDAYLSPSVADVLVPFASGYHRWWQALGILGGWALVILGLSFYVRGRIGVQRWRTVHRFTGVAWVASLAHSLGEGTDAGRWWFVVLLFAPIVPAAVALALRRAGVRRPRRSGPARSTSADVPAVPHQRPSSRHRRRRRAAAG